MAYIDGGELTTRIDQLLDIAIQVVTGLQGAGQFGNRCSLSRTLAMAPDARASNALRFGRPDVRETGLRPPMYLVSDILVDCFEGAPYKFLHRFN